MRERDVVEAAVYARLWVDRLSATGKDGMGHAERREALVLAQRAADSYGQACHEDIERRAALRNLTSWEDEHCSEDSEG